MRISEDGRVVPWSTTWPSLSIRQSMSGIMKPLETPVGVHKKLPSPSRTEMFPSLAAIISRSYRRLPMEQICSRSSFSGLPCDITLALLILAWMQYPVMQDAPQDKAGVNARYALNAGDVLQQQPVVIIHVNH